MSNRLKTYWLLVCRSDLVRHFVIGRVPKPERSLTFFLVKVNLLGRTVSVNLAGKSKNLPFACRKISKVPEYSRRKFEASISESGPQPGAHKSPTRY